jgi:hypothetical protein
MTITDRIALGRARATSTRSVVRSVKVAPKAKSLAVARKVAHRNAELMRRLG